jgi:hypothetical protein
MLETQKAPGSLTLSILKANVANPAYTDRITYRPARPPAGLGLGLTTYLSDGQPLPSFSGDPLLLPCQGHSETVLDAYWSALNAENRIAIAVKHIPDDGSNRTIVVRNRFAV